MLKSSMCQALCAGDLSNVIAFIPSKVPGKLTRLSQIYRWGNKSSERLKLLPIHAGRSAKPRYRFGWSHHYSLFLFHAVVLNAWAPCRPLTQSERPETMPSPPATDYCELQLQSLGVGAQPLCLLPAPHFVGPVPPFNLPAGHLAANHTCFSWTTNLKTHLQETFSEFIGINIYCILFHKEFD